MTKNLLTLLKSLLKVILIALIPSAGVYYAGFNAIPVFTCSVAIQFVIAYVVSTYRDTKIAMFNKAVALKEAEIIAQNTLKVSCAACKKDGNIVLHSEHDMQFVCEFCGAKNSVYVNTETAVVTEPLYDTAPIPNTASTNGL